MPSNAKEASYSQKLSKGGIPLANGDAFVQKPLPWAYPLWTTHKVYRNINDRMSRSTARAIDEAMTRTSEVKVKFVSVSLSLETQLCCQVEKSEVHGLRGNSHSPTSTLEEDAIEASSCLDDDLEWVRVVLTADPGVRMEDIQDQPPPRQKEHRRVPSTVAIEEVKAAAVKGEAPIGLTLKGAGQDSSDAQPRMNGSMPKAGDALSGELWEARKREFKRLQYMGILLVGTCDLLL